MDTDETYTEKVRQKLHKNATSYTEQIWNQHPTKQQLYGHLSLKPSK